MKRRISAGLLIAALVLGGCGSQIATPVPQPTLNPQPTAAGLPTSVPTVASLPTAAPTAIVQPTTVATAIPAPATAIPATPLPAAEPSVDPNEAVQRFVAALQADRTGRAAARFADGELARVLGTGLPDIGGLLGEQNPFTGFTVDGVLSDAPPFAYVQVTFAYGSPPTPTVTRVLDAKWQNGGYLVTAIGPASPLQRPAATPQQLVAQFLDALRADPSGRQVAQFAGGSLAQALASGVPGVEALLGEPVPFDSFSVDRELEPAPPFSYVQVTLAYGNPAQRRATRLVTVQDENGTLRVTALAPVAPDDPAQSAAQQVRNATAEFLARLNEGRFQEAGARFGGDLEPILAQNPDLSGDPLYNPELRGQLLERYCRADGGGCLGQRRIVDAEATGEGSFTLWVEFNRPDGTLYQDAAQPLRVQNVDGSWRVLDLPPRG